MFFRKICLFQIDRYETKLLFLKKFINRFWFWSYAYCNIDWDVVFLGVTPVYFNEKEYYGYLGFIGSISISIFMCIIFSILCYLFLNLGIFFYNKLFSCNK